MDSRLNRLSIRNLKIIDSKTISLFSEILQGIGRNRWDVLRKKGCTKVHALMDDFSGVTEFVRITFAKEHDRKFLYHLKLPAGSWLDFDKAYITYLHFTKWTSQNIWFVSQIKDKAESLDDQR